MNKLITETLVRSKQIQKERHDTFYSFPSADFYKFVFSFATQGGDPDHRNGGQYILNKMLHFLSWYILGKDCTVKLASFGFNISNLQSLASPVYCQSCSVFESAPQVICHYVSHVRSLDTTMRCVLKKIFVRVKFSTENRR